MDIEDKIAAKQYQKQKKIVKNINSQINNKSTFNLINRQEYHAKNLFGSSQQ